MPTSLTPSGTPGASGAAFVGRSAQLDVLERTVDEALGGQPRVAIVQGPAGIGKSRLVCEILKRAERRGAAVLIGRCVEGSEVPYLPLVNALDPLRGELGARLQIFDRDEPADPRQALGAQPASVLVAACNAVATVARRRPVVLMLEDLHWADRYTVELFDHLVANGTSPSRSPTALLFVTTMRSATGAIESVVGRLRRQITSLTVNLAPMDELELNQLVTAIAGHPPSRAFLAGLAEATGGNPLLARTVVERLIGTGRLEVQGGHVTTTDEILADVDDLDRELWARIGQVGEQCRTMLTAAAFLGDGGNLADLESLSAGTGQDFDALLDEAEHNGLLTDDADRFRFDHPLVRQLLYHEPGGRRRRQIHLRIADCLEARHADDPRRCIEIAEHLRHCRDLVTASRLARWSRRAGDQAFVLAAWGTAARFLDIAVAADPPQDPGERGRLHLNAGIAHFRDHDLESTERSLQAAITEARQWGDDDTWATAALLVTRARMTIGPGSLGSGVDTSELEDLRVAISPTGRVAGEIAGLLAEIRFHAFDFNGGLPMVDEARRLAALNADDELATNVELAAALQHLGRLDVDEADRALRSSEEHARRLADPWKILWGLGRRPLVDVLRGDLVGGADHAEAATDLASRHHDWAEHALASAGAAQVAVAQGRWQAVEVARAAALKTHLRSDYPFVPMLIHPAVAAARSSRGDIDGADRALDEWAATGTRGLAPYRMLALAIGGDHEALAGGRAFRPVGRQPHHLLTLPILCAQVEIGTTLGDRELVEDAHHPLTTLYRSGVRWSLGWPLLIARLLGGASRVLGRLDDAEEWCDRAALDASTGKAPGEAARVELERSLVALARGDAATARELAGAAALEFDRLGMLPLYHRARQIAGHDHVAPPTERTVLFTDLVGSTAMNVRRGDAEFVELLDRHNSILRARLRQFDGVEVKHTGDGMCAWFSSSSDACGCAIAMRADLADHNALHPDAQLHVRFGMAAGSPIAREGDFFGISVTLAARLCDKAAPGQILVSSDVAVAVGGSSASLRRVAPLELKGFPDPVDAFELTS